MDKHQNENVKLYGIEAEFRDALEEEIYHIKKTGQTSTILLSGRRVASKGEDFWYSFDVEYMPTLPDDTPCKLVVGKDFYDVTVVSLNEKEVTISSKLELPPSISNVRLENGSTVLMERLIKCIEENADKQNVAGEKMLDINYDAKDTYHYERIERRTNTNDEQYKALCTAISKDITYIWGPPGTGKTTVIGQIIEELYDRDRTVLIVSHTNNAVDGAIEKAQKFYNKRENFNENYPILRLGTSVKKELDERTTLKEHVNELGRELAIKKEELEKQEQKAEGRINDIDLFFIKENWYKNNNVDNVIKTNEEIVEINANLSEAFAEKGFLVNKSEELKAENPEYEETRKAYFRYKELKSEHEEKVKEKEKLAEELKECKDFAEDISDEIKKHIKYKEITDKLDQMMSAKFLQSTIYDIRKQIENIQASIEEQIKEKKELEKKVLEYESKSSFGKMLSNKNNYETNKKSIDEINDRLFKHEEDLQRLTRREREYKKQFEERLFLQDHLQIIKPTKIADYWKDLEQNNTNKINTVQNSMNEIAQHIKQSAEELLTLKQDIETDAKKYENIIRLEEKIKIINDKIKDIKEKLSLKEGEFSVLVRTETEECSRFEILEESFDSNQITKCLQELRRKIQQELLNVDLASLKSEKELIKESLIDIRRQLAEIKIKMQQLEQQAILNAKIIGTTLAKSYLDEMLRSRSFDTVILDEASMASIPALWCASYLADKSIVIVGDFLQLPPIVMAETPMAEKWLGRDIFDHSGMQEKARGNIEPSNFIKLNKQYRMETEIADIANMYYGEYGGLETEHGLGRDDLRNQFKEWFPDKDIWNGSINLIDTESLNAWVTGIPQGKGSSRLNSFSAAVTVDLAFSFVEKLLDEQKSKASPQRVDEAKVLIIAPYRPHVKRIEKLIKLEYKNRGFEEDLNYIRVGTIHSFQGDEADIVIFDLVIDEPHWRADLFMNNEDANKRLKKMFNVAVTRARFKLFVVGNFSYCQKKAKNNPLADLLDQLVRIKKLKSIDAKAILPSISYTKDTVLISEEKISGLSIVCREDVFADYLVTDLHNCKRQIVIYSAFMTENRLAFFLPHFVDAINAEKKILVVTKDLEERGKREKAQYEKCEKELKNIGVNIIHKRGMHEKVVFVDDDIVWSGSLNTLSFTGLTGEIMHRFKDKNVSNAYKESMELDKLCDVIETVYEQECPVCNCEMILRDGDKGKLYWECSGCDYKRNSNQRYPVDGILRCDCGAEYKFFMKNEPRWVCTSNPKHYQKVRKSDLKLPEMVKLIPTVKERKAVEQYFDKKSKEQKDKKKADNSKKKKNGNVSDNELQLEMEL